MISGKRVLVVVPARGGSKGLPNKNILPLCGIPLVALVGRVVRNIPHIDRSVVSTDSPEIARVAAEAGIAAPFMRPSNLSGDIIGDVDVLTHAVLATEAVDNCTYEIVIMLQPTSPLRTASEVIECLQMLVDNNADSVWSVSKSDKKYHPLKQLSVNGKRLSFYDPRGSQVIARQQLDELYYRNGVAYIVTRDCLMNEQMLLGKRAFACISTTPHISIDTAEDLVLAERYAKEHQLFLDEGVCAPNVLGTSSYSQKNHA
jgi:CMP-N,N'-diacetyllegionaminic acid synthase